MNMVQTGGGSVRDPGDGRQAESEAARVGERLAAPAAHQELARTRPQRQEQQPLHRPRTMHGTAQDLPARPARRLLLTRRPPNADEKLSVTD